MATGTFCVYILATDRNGTLYTGYTADLAKRIYTHKQKLVKCFTEKYSIDKLVYVEPYEYVYDAKKESVKLKNGIELGR